MKVKPKTRTRGSSEPKLSADLMYSDSSGSSPEELRLLYQLCVGDIANSKKEQFEITNYTLLIQAGFVYLSQNSKVVQLPSQWKASACVGLMILSVVFSVAAIRFLRTLQQNISRSRARILRVRSKFSTDFHAAFGPEEASVYATLRFRRGILYTMISLLVLSSVAVPVLIWLNLYR